MAQLTDAKRKKIIADYIDCQNYREVARKYSIAPNTVKNIVANDKEKIAQACTQKKEENTQDTLTYIQEQSETKKRIVEKLLTAIETKAENVDIFTNIRDLTTAYGTIIDKELKFAEIMKEKPKENTSFYIPGYLLSKSFVDPYRSIREEKAYEFIFKGGRGSLKSTFISEMIIEILKNNPEGHFIILRNIADTLRGSVYMQMLWSISKLGLDIEFDPKVSPLEITLKATGQKMYFRGANEPDNIKSIKVPFGYIIGAWFEELDQFLGEEAIRKIEQSTIRGGAKGFIFKSFNPPKTQNNWANKYILTPKKGQLIFHSDYRDVPRDWLGEIFINDAKHLKEINEIAYRHEYLGEIVGTGNNVFDNITLREITDKEVNSFDRIYCGNDWGWYPDPNHFSEMYYNAVERKLYIFGEVRCNKTKNQAYALLVEKWKDYRITSDTGAEGLKSNADMRDYGFDWQDARKGPGSVEYSMKWLASLTEIIIDPTRCPFTAEEFVSCEFLKDKEGNAITGYEDKNNHAIDSVRYALEEVWRKRGQ